MEYNQNDLLKMLQTFFQQFRLGTPITVININKVERFSENVYAVGMMLVVNMTTMVQAEATVDTLNGYITSFDIPNSRYEDTTNIQPAYPNIFKSAQSDVPVVSSLDRLMAAHRQGRPI